MIRNSVRTRESAKFLLATQCLIFATCSFLAGAVHSATIEAESISAMEWRNVGPFRGGRVMAV